MNVKLGGWAYILAATFALFGLKRIHETGEKIVVLADIAIYFVLGVGLLQRRNWARWQMLGVSLLNWTLGSLAFCWALVQAFRMHYFSPDRSLGFHATVTTLIVMGAAFIRINYRLFAHLKSEDGRFEFATPDSERNAVAKSAAVYFAWCVLSVVLAR